MHTNAYACIQVRVLTFKSRIKQKSSRTVIEGTNENASKWFAYLA